VSAYAILGRDTARFVAVVLRERGMDEAPVRIAEKGQGITAMDEAARVPADILLLDVNTGPGLGPAVLRYRLARQDTRVVLLAPGKVPGDAEVAGVVQAGVYDVVTDLEDLGAVLDRPAAGLAAAALWLDPALAPEASSKEQVRERVIERRVAVSQRPVLVTVAGTAQGVGTTVTACTLAGYLARRGHRTVLVESCDLPSLGVITGMDILESPASWLPNLDVCVDPNPRNLVRGRQHSYVVADMGACPRGDLGLLDADLVLVVLPLLHRIIRAVAWLKSADMRPDEPYGVRYVVTGEASSGRKVAGTWEAICAEEGGLEGLKARVPVSLLPVEGVRELPPGYRYRSDELDRACGEILEEVLPDSIRKPRRPWFPLGRRG